MPVINDVLVEKAQGTVSTAIGSEIVIMSAESGFFCQVNRVGAAIWNLLEKPARVSELCQRLQDTFDVEPGACLADVTEFLTSMQRLSMVRMSNS